MKRSISLLLYLVQVLFNKKTEQLLGVHIIGLHAADLIQECANAMMAGTTVRQLAMMVSYLMLCRAVRCCFTDHTCSISSSVVVKLIFGVLRNCEHYCISCVFAVRDNDILRCVGN